MQCFCCSSRNVVAIYKSNVADVYRCKTCTLIFSRPKVDTNQLYDENYFRNYLRIEYEQTANSRKLLAMIRKFKRSGSILDYGCGTGIFLKVASESGFTNNVGVDGSSSALELARQRVSEQDQLLDSANDVIPDRRFAVISFIDSMAHIPDVSRLLRTLIQSNLEPDGVLFIRTPNINRLYYLYVRLMSTVLPVKCINSFYFIPNRLFLMNRRAMAAFLDSFGFEAHHWSFERDYPSANQATTLRRKIANLILKTIPRWLNPNNSMTLVARKK